MSVTNQQDKGTAPVVRLKVTGRIVILGWIVLSLAALGVAIAMVVRAETIWDVLGTFGMGWVARELASTAVDAAIRRGRELDRDLNRCLREMLKDPGEERS